MAFIRAIVKRPDEPYGHVCNISDRLEALQRTVGGYIQALTLDKDVVVLCDEEGRLKGQTPNCSVCGIPFGGVIAAVGYKGEEFADLPISMKDWKSNYLGGSYARE